MEDKIVSVAVNPGNIKTDLQRHMPGWQHSLVVRGTGKVSLNPAEVWCRRLPLEAHSIPDSYGCAHAAVGRSIAGGSQTERPGLSKTFSTSLYILDADARASLSYHGLALALRLPRRKIQCWPRSSGYGLTNYVAIASQESLASVNTPMIMCL